MSLRAVFTLLFTLFTLYLQAQQFEKETFYAAISSEEIALVDTQLKLLKKASFKEKEAFEGALLMKKAGLVSNVKDKLSFFKKGHSKLEDAIKKDQENIEFRFLRLIIQENAPAILNYNNDLEQDSVQIKLSFDNLSSVVQKAIMDYSKKSKILTPSDFQK